MADRLIAGMASVSGPSGRAGWIETLVVTFLTLAVSWLTHPDDPFLLGAGFPWLLLAPLFLSLRHGFAFGFVAALFIIALLTGARRFDMIGVDVFPSSWVLGMLIVTMLAGEFSDLWQRRLGRVELENAQRDRRMEEFTRSYHLLKVSHDQLVEQLAGSSVSLRQAIAGLREEVLRAGRRADDLLQSESETMLALFRRYGAVQSASLHRVIGEELVVEPLARLGAVPEDMDALAHSAIVAEALRSGEMVSVLAAENGSPLYADGNILAVAPIRELDGNTRALLVIYRIPFLKFTDDNLSLIAVMSSYLGDLLQDLEKELQGEDEARTGFLAELARSIHYVSRYGMQARLVSVELLDPDAADELMKQRRSLDKTWLRHARDGRAVVLWLMPFTDDYGVAGFQARINLWAQQRFLSESGENMVNIRVFPLTGRQGMEALLTRVADACDLDDC